MDARYQHIHPSRLVCRAHGRSYCTHRDCSERCRECSGTGRIRESMHSRVIRGMQQGRPLADERECDKCERRGRTLTDPVLPGERNKPKGEQS